MSTVVPEEGGVDDPGAPIRSLDELGRYFEAGEKPREAFRIGTEHEKFGFLVENHAPLPYEGPRGIEAILAAIAEDEAESQSGPWRRVEENGRIIALAKKNATISLEPGGQLELSGAPVATLHETCEEVGYHLDLLKRVCMPRGVGFIGIGFHPTARWEDMPVVPKSRYRIMERYMPKRGSRGLDMMKRTSTVQANFDYESEADMVATFRTALAIAPLCTALFANSPFRDGKPTGNLSERTLVWTDTDPDRTGFPDVVFAKDFGYARWLEWVLSVPMYFVRRGGEHLDYAGADFRVFLKDGLDGHRATLRDFEDHLTTVFPEVRLKQYLEVRSADCGPWSRICALPALYKGILYDPEARDGAWALMDEPTPEELRALQVDAARNGFRATYRGRSMLALCESLLELSRAGLERIRSATRGRDERGFLRPLEEAVSEGKTFAERLLDRFFGPWGGSLEPLWDELEFFEQSYTADRLH